LGGFHAFLRRASSFAGMLSWMRRFLASIVIESPSFTRAITPPSWASGAIWPTTVPQMPPEKRPSVRRPTEAHRTQSSRTRQIPERRIKDGQHAAGGRGTGIQHSLMAGANCCAVAHADKGQKSPFGPAVGRHSRYAARRRQMPLARALIPCGHRRPYSVGRFSFMSGPAEPIPFQHWPLSSSKAKQLGWCSSSWSSLSWWSSLSR
jgi:hypothetical protein